MALRLAPFWLALLTAGWSAGFFWSWSFTVMPGLAAAEPQHALAAMQAANANIRSPFFAFVFFGAALTPLLAAGSARGSAASRWALAAGVVQFLGVIGVTLAVNVPMNEALARLDPGAAGSVAAWRDYLARWTAWNHIRVAAATLSLLLAAQALRVR
jgi:uncharacterized membrane protein